MPSVKPTRKRTAEHLHKAKKPMRFKKQKNYHSSSESEDELDEPHFAPVTNGESNGEVETTPVADSTKYASLEDVQDAEKKEEGASEDDEEEAEGLDTLADEDDEPELEEDDSLSSDASDLDGPTEGEIKKRKRNDPSAFAMSMSKILSSKLSASKRADPVLARSAAAANSQKEMADSKLEAQAKQKLRAEKKAALERGRVKDVLGLETEGVSTAEIQERERRLKKTAQRGVVKLFNAVRAAQVQADTARSQTIKEGVIGMGQREQRINEMSKQGFLDLIAKGGKKGAVIEES